MKTPARTFADYAATRERTPLLVGLVGPSGSGKTYSALRLATGIQRVAGGDIWYIDTEARRALHYADLFKFRHLPFVAPFGPLDYLAAVQYCRDKGARTIVIDSMSHEHEGPGGVLEMHTEELERLSRGDPEKAERFNMLAWKEPKAQRRRLINTILQLEANFVCCFRAKEKLKIETGKPPRPLGWQPIAGPDYLYEMTVNCLLYPASGGVPNWRPDERGEREMIKLPGQFQELFKTPAPLSEAIGEGLARWAAGVQARPQDGAPGPGPGPGPGPAPAPAPRIAPGARPNPRWTKVLTAFEPYEIDAATLLAAAGCVIPEDLTEDNYRRLRQSLKDLKAGRDRADVFPNLITTTPGPDAEAIMASEGGRKG